MKSFSQSACIIDQREARAFGLLRLHKYQNKNSEKTKSPGNEVARKFALEDEACWTCVQGQIISNSPNSKLATHIWLY